MIGGVRVTLHHEMRWGEGSWPQIWFRYQKRKKKVGIWYMAGTSWTRLIEVSLDVASLATRGQNYTAHSHNTDHWWAQKEGPESPFGNGFQHCVQRVHWKSICHMPARSNYMLKGKNMQMAHRLALAIFSNLIFLYSLIRYYLELALK